MYTMTKNTLPPYGIFPHSHEHLGQQNEMMPDWQHQIPDADARQTAFLNWRTDIRNTLSDVIWPYFDRATRQWTGAAENTAECVTELEIKLMIQHFQGKQDQLQLQPNLCKNPDFGDTHLGQFRVEDAPSKPAGVNIRDYVCSLTDEQFAYTRQIIEQAYDRKIKSLFWLKREFVRPRPYQCAMIFGCDTFHTEVAFSAMHSSFYSGHCLEGILFSAAVAEAWSQDGESFDSDGISSLMRYAVDFGDRRVFAGVHYPSDNIASWYIALKLIPQVFDDPALVHQFVVDAITHHSTVYKLISTEYVNHPLLIPGVDLLHSAFHFGTGST